MSNPINSRDNKVPVSDERSESQMSDVNDGSPLRPTHHLEQIKVGENGTQLLVSTQDHVYNATNVEGGNNSFQCVGGWSDTSIHELAQMLISHQNRMPQFREAVSGASAFKGPGYVVKQPGKDRKSPEQL
ncbi:hypothetical protein EsH8_IV_000060 [Colletotrichum jinshuiense]